LTCILYPKKVPMITIVVRKIHKIIIIYLGELEVVLLVIVDYLFDKLI